MQLISLGLIVEIQACFFFQPDQSPRQKTGRIDWELSPDPLLPSPRVLPYSRQKIRVLRTRSNQHLDASTFPASNAELFGQHPFCKGKNTANITTMTAIQFLNIP